MNAGWLLTFAALGAAVAALVNWGADVLPPGGRHARPSLWARDRGSLVLQRHALVTIACLAGVPLLAVATGEYGRALWLAGWGAVFLLIAVIDLEHRLVLNSVLIAAALVSLAASLAGVPMAPAPLEALLGCLVGLLLFAVVAALGRGAMGAGDVKLAAVIGLIVGYPQVLSALLAGVLFGGLAAVVALLRGLGRKAAIPYAPWLVAGAMVALLQAAVRVPL